MTNTDVSEVKRFPVKITLTLKADVVVDEIAEHEIVQFIGEAIDASDLDNINICDYKVDYIPHKKFR